MAKPRIIGRIREDGDRCMLVAPERGFVLRGGARAILELCDGTRSEAEIVAALAARHAADPEVIARDVRQVLELLRARALVEDA